MNTLHGTFVLLRADSLRLLLPQSDVGAAEYLELRPRPTGRPGMLRDRDGRAYAALSDAMTLLDECPPGRFLGCRLAGSPDDIVWCWDELRVLIDFDAAAVALPDAIRVADAPIDSYVELDGAPAFLCRAADLCRLVLPASGERRAA